MKKWNNPELMVLGIENTNDCGCTCSNGATMFKTDNNTHYCHFLDEWHENNCPATLGHKQTGNCVDGPHWNDGHKSNCCCGHS